ncbi:cytochrome b/b6 domain-containing protein [Tibeticola sp.]|uniref:cytochrome b/b6 domain-containing protein n=1 Tax=Tibeticola sp. TaxID=2005368 RepID=UPI0025E77D96|nr:cytochrome b/b6 domain-containing protein [Tibeticola sp.]
MRNIRVWDLPTRLFHWLLVVAVVGLVVTGNIGGNAMVWHFRLGYFVGSLVAFRLIWGFVGGHWSRFSSFLYAPRATVAYLRGQAEPAHLVGHNPLGAFSVFALLGLLAAQVATGLMSDDEIANAGPLTRFVSEQTVSLATRYHADIGKLLLIVLVALHVLAIAFYAWKKHVNLVRPMVLGDKAVDDGQALPASRDDAPVRVLAAVIFAACAAGMAWISSLG